MKLKKILFMIVAVAMLFSVGTTAMAEETTTVAKIGDVEYVDFVSAMTAANAMTGSVTVEIYGAVEFIDGMELKGNYDSISFVGVNDNAKITINQTAGGDYLEAHGKNVAFTDLMLAKANPAWAGNSGHMGNYFSVQGGTAIYTDCTFPNGACTSEGTATYNNCTFKNTSEYGLWIYDDALVTVNGGTIDSKKGIKVYSEDETTVTSTITVQNATFTENITAKPAVAIGYAESVTLIGNTYNNQTGVLELDSGSDADCNGITFVAKDASGNDITSTLTAVDRSGNNAACGAFVTNSDGITTIYTSVAKAAQEAAEGDTVTLLYDSTETVELTEGVVLDKNGFTADGITVNVTAVAYIGEQGYETVQAAINAAQNGETVTICAGEYSAINISNKNITIQGTVGDNGELLTTIKGGNPAITGHSFNGTIKDIKIVDAWKVMYAEPAGNVTIDNVYVTGATYGFHLVAYSSDLTWEIKNSYMDLAWANSFGVYEDGNADIIIKGNEFISTNPYYPEYGALHINSFLPNVTIEENIFRENARIYIDGSVTDTSNIKISKNYHADGIENAFAADAEGVTVKVNSYYTEVDENGNLTGLVITPDGSINGGLVNLQNSERTFLTIESYLTYASESVVVKVYDKNDTLLVTSSLIDNDRVILGKENWGGLSTMVGINCTDAWWNTAWETGKLNANYVPAKATLFVDGIEMNTAPIQMRAAGTETEVVWAEVPGVPAAKLPKAEVTNLGAIKVTEENGDGDYKFGTSYYEYDLINTQKLTTATAPFDLNVAMQFVAKDEPEEAKTNAYAEYTTDFFIKIDGLKNGSFVGNGCYLAGYYPSFEAWVKIPLDGFTVEDGKVYPVISSAGFDFSYVDICTSVEDFICGIYLTPEIIENNPDINVNLTLGLSETLEKAQNAEFEKVDDYTYTAEDFVDVELFEFYGSNIKLGNSLALNFAIDKTNINGTDYYAEIEHVTDSGIEKTTIPFTKWELDGNYYVIRYSGIVARQITDDINITVYNGDGKQVSAKYEDGLKKYAMRMIGKSSSEKLKTALVDMLNYGAAAQKEFGYKSDALANADLTDIQKSYASDMPTIVDKSERESEKCVGSNLALVENIKMNMAFTGLKDGMYVEYEYTNHYGEKISKRVDYADLAVNNVIYRVLTIDTFVIADANQIVTATVYNADGTVYTVCKDSMNSYLARQLVKGDLESGLYSAIAKFTASSYNYLH